MQNKNKERAREREGKKIERSDMSRETREPFFEQIHYSVNNDVIHMDLEPGQSPNKIAVSIVKLF